MTNGQQWQNDYLIYSAYTTHKLLIYIFYYVSCSSMFCVDVAITEYRNQHYILLPSRNPRHVMHTNDISRENLIRLKIHCSMCMTQFNNLYIHKLFILLMSSNRQIFSLKTLSSNVLRHHNFHALPSQAKSKPMPPVQN